jgi:cytochrome c oxidase subunit II
MITGRIALGLGALGLWPAGAVFAQSEPVPADLPVIGVPVADGTGFQPAVTSLARDLQWLDGMVHAIMVAIVLFVVALLAIVIVRFNSRSNTTPARFTHNTKVEIAWTIVPVVILILIGSFSLPILFKQLEIPEPDLTVKTTGNQWYWSYEYPDNEFSFESLMLRREELADFGYDDDLYLLATDTALVVPVGAVVKLQVTGSDVIHSWAMPAFGVKMDAVPGRLNETWFQVDEPGLFFGQCSELCGKDHSYMPITVRAVSPEDYAAWLDWAIEEYGGTRGEADLALAQ